MYFKLIDHLKNIFIGSESIVRPNKHRNVYLTGPYAFNIFFSNVWLNTKGNIKRYAKTKMKPTDSLNKILAGVS